MKLFTAERYRSIVLARLKQDLIDAGVANEQTRVVLGLAVGRIYQKRTEQVREFMRSREMFFWSLPALAVIAFNGGTAERIGLKALGSHGDRLRIVRLPSSSPAHTMPYAEKLPAWQALRSWLAQSA